jgi:hypothetical protein
MLSPIDLARKLSLFPAAGPFLIATGLALLLASIVFPVIPAVTAMAILTVGATEATLARYRYSPALPTIMLVHAPTYFSLYATFIAATLYVPVGLPAHTLSVRLALDLVASIPFMAIALRRIVVAQYLAAETRP